MKRLTLLCLFLTGCATAHHYVRPVLLLTEDGSEIVASLDPAMLMDEDGRLPDPIIYQGRTFERLWGEGDSDAPRRLWYEEAKEKP